MKELLEAPYIYAAGVIVWSKKEVDREVIPRHGNRITRDVA
jgi:hypothetical protein